jgi:hypothetical protein
MDNFFVKASLASLLCWQLLCVSHATRVSLWLLVAQSVVFLLFRHNDDCNGSGV